MAFGQTNTGFKVGIGANPFNTGFNSGFSSNSGTNNRNSTTRNNKKSYDDTYNPRYPGFNEEDYKRLERMVDEKGLTGWEKTDTMDQLYQVYLPQVLNRHKLDERQQEINDSVYKNGEALLNGDKEVTMGTDLTKLAQEAKKKYNIPYNVDDNELIKDIVADTENGNKLLYEYTQNGNPEIFYAAGIWDRPQQMGGTKDLINQAGATGEKTRGEKDLREKGETVTNYTNVIGLGTEKLDNAANKFADKFMVTGEKAANNLADRINNMSKEEVAQYRKQYEKLLKDKDFRAAQVRDTGTLVGNLWERIKGDVYYDYDDEEFMKWLISQKANLGESLIGADDILKGETNPNVIQFFGNIPSSALKTFTATVRGMTNPYDTMKGLYKIAFTKEGHQAILDRYGSWEAFAKAMNTDPVGVADDILAVAELGTNIAKGGLKFTGKVTGNQSLINMGNNIPTIGSANDVLAQKTVGGIYGGLDKVASMTDNKLVQGANRYVQDVSSLQKAVDETKNLGNAIADSSVGQAVKNWKDEMVDKIVGIDEKDRDFIQNNKEIVNEYLDGKRSVETVFDEVKEKISDKRLQNSEMGQEYGKLRKNKSKIVNTEGITTDMKKTLKKQGITIDKDGNLKFSDMSKFNAKQKAALVDAWNELKLVEKKKNINAGNVLDMRQKFDDKLNWDGKAMDLNGNLSSVDKATEGLIKDMRGVIDNRAKKSVAGLKELDAKYSEAIAEMQQIKKDWLNADGTLKDTARSKLRNLTKAGNEAKLERLEKLAPGITNDLRALDVGLTVERATKQGVGQYSKSIGVAGTVGALASGNVPALLASIGVGILATPKNFVRVLEAYPDIVQKLSAGQELLPSDVARLQALASRIEDGMEE